MRRSPKELLLEGFSLVSHLATCQTAGGGLRSAHGASWQQQEGWDVQIPVLGARPASQEPSSGGGSPG